MDDSPGRKSLGSDVWKESNVFSPEITDILYSECLKQLEHNALRFKNGEKHISNCVLDCHGLSVIKNGSVERDPQFPYCIEEWNEFLLKIQEIMFAYCDKNGIDKSIISPHSCWIETSRCLHVNSSGFSLVKNDDSDLWLDSECGSEVAHYKVIYILKDPNPGLAIRVVKDGENIDFSGSENCLYVLPSKKYDFYVAYPDNSDAKINLVFDWYLHPKDSKMSSPAWKIPNKHDIFLNEDNVSIFIDKRLATFIKKRLNIDSLDSYFLSKVKEDLNKLVDKKKKG